jgi:hypothetical protein
VHPCTPVTSTDVHPSMPVRSTVAHTCATVRNTTVHGCVVVLCTGVHPMHACFPHLGAPHVHGSPNYSRALVHVKHSIARALGGPPSQNPLVRPSVQALPKKEPLATVQEDTTTNLKLVDPESAGSISQNLQISPQISRPITLAAGTNEVAMWALQLYIVPFSKLPYSILGAPSIHFPIRLQPRDQDPATYTVTFPGPPSILGPRGAFFSHHAQVRMLMFKIIK